MLNNDLNVEKHKLTIIVNFSGNENNIFNIPKTELSCLDNLENTIRENKITIIAVIGVPDDISCDALIDYNNKWYEKFFNIIDKFNDIETELHTAIYFSNFYTGLFTSIYYYMNTTLFANLNKINKCLFENIYLVYELTNDTLSYIYKNVMTYKLYNSEKITDVIFNVHENVSYDFKKNLQEANDKRICIVNFLGEQDKVMNSNKEIISNLYYCNNKVYADINMLKK